VGNILLKPFADRMFSVSWRYIAEALIHYFGLHMSAYGKLGDPASEICLPLAPKNLVKPQNTLNHYPSTIYSWHTSYPNLLN
jgi:hypothetical protein